MFQSKIKVCHMCSTICSCLPVRRQVCKTMKASKVMKTMKVAKNPGWSVKYQLVRKAVRPRVTKGRGASIFKRLNCGFRIAINTAIARDPAVSVILGNIALPPQLNIRNTDTLRSLQLEDGNLLFQKHLYVYRMLILCRPITPPQLFRKAFVEYQKTLYLGRYTRTAFVDLVLAVKDVNDQSQFQFMQFDSIVHFRLAFPLILERLNRCFDLCPWWSRENLNLAVTPDNKVVDDQLLQQNFNWIQNKILRIPKPIPNVIQTIPKSDTKSDMMRSDGESSLRSDGESSDGESSDGERCFKTSKIGQSSSRW